MYISIANTDMHIHVHVHKNHIHMDTLISKMEPQCMEIPGFSWPGPGGVPQATDCPLLARLRPASEASNLRAGSAPDTLQKSP